MLKDHKPAQEDGLHKICPLDNCIGATSEPLSEINCLILDNIVEDHTHTMFSSAEEIKGKFMEVNSSLLNDSMKRLVLSLLDNINYHSTTSWVPNTRPIQPSVNIKYEKSQTQLIPN